MNIIETPRLTIRHFTLADLDDFAALCADPRAMAMMGDGATLPRAEVERWIGVCEQKYATRGYGTSAVFEKESGEFVGFCGVVRAPDNDFDEIIYAFRVDRWGRGYATECARGMLAYVFEHSRLDRIWATIDPRNASSIRVVEKLGFRFDRQEVEPDGVQVNYYFVERPPAK